MAFELPNSIGTHTEMKLAKLPQTKPFHQAKRLYTHTLPLQKANDDSQRRGCNVGTREQSSTCIK
jgi:hypothetical protein